MEEQIALTRAARRGYPTKRTCNNVQVLFFVHFYCAAGAAMVKLSSKFCITVSSRPVKVTTY